MNSSDSVLASPARGFTALSVDELRRCAPSVFAENARPGVSPRYTFVSTAQVAAAQAVAEGTPHVLETVTKWQAIELTELACPKARSSINRYGNSPLSFRKTETLQEGRRRLVAPLLNHDHVE